MFIDKKLRMSEEERNELVAKFVHFEAKIGQIERRLDKIEGIIEQVHQKILKVQNKRKEEMILIPGKDKQ